MTPIKTPLHITPNTVVTPKHWLCEQPKIGLLKKKKSVRKPLRYSQFAFVSCGAQKLMCLSLLSTPGSFSRHPKWPAVCRTSMRPSTCLESRPTTALICTRTSPAASNHVKSTSANQIETDFISSFLSMQLNTLESHAKLERWTVFNFLFFFWHIHHTHKHFLTYTPTLLQKDTWAR